ncbi:MAG: hypothetical protein H7A27_01445 [Spirochaetaceae bacterium]|nr:hypothetical protein [Spirochaetaceae bacterium]
MTRRRWTGPAALPAMLAALIAAAAAMSPPPVPAQETGARDAVAVAAVAEDEAAAPFAEALAAALRRELAAAGFAAAAYAGDAAGGGDAAAIGAATGSRWVAVARCLSDGRRVVWRAAVYDLLDGALVAAESGAAFAGLTALAMLDESAAAAAATAYALRGRTAPGQPIDYRLRFASPDDGAILRFGTGAGARDAAVVEGGEATAVFVAFRAGDPVVVSIEKDGYWPRALVFRPGEADEPIDLPALMPVSRGALALGVAATRLAGVSAEYRYGLLPDALFLRAADSLWLGSAWTAGAKPLVHDELRLGLGAYLFMPRRSRFRLAAGAGLSAVGTAMTGASAGRKYYLDLTLDAPWLSYEWHEPAWAAYVEQRIAYSFGLDSGLLRRGWLDGATGPMIITAGVMLKWP